MLLLLLLRVERNLLLAPPSVPQPVPEFRPQRLGEGLQHRNVPVFLVTMDQTVLVQVIDGPPRPGWQGRMPRQVQDALQLPVRHDRLSSSFAAPRTIVSDVQVQELGGALGRVKELRRRIEVFPDPPHRHVRIGTLEPAIVPIDCRVESSGDVVALVVLVGLPIAANRFHQLLDLQMLVLGAGGNGRSAPGGRPDQRQRFVPYDQKAHHHVEAVQQVRRSPPKEGALEGQRLVVPHVHVGCAPTLDRVEGGRRRCCCCRRRCCCCCSYSYCRRSHRGFIDRAIGI
mmetsp:Transcript_26361/g.61757  ORF Transcript_26361/g.61757 Transcript_26361/m.61757 type:complete len:285 (-) Transcript_26361:325-1179(-)